MADFNRGSGTTSQRSTTSLRRPNIFGVNGPVVPSAIVCGVTDTGPPASKAFGHRA